MVANVDKVPVAEANCRLCLHNSDVLSLKRTIVVNSWNNSLEEKNPVGA
ncbi:TPA: hypothetical protein N0F65_011930 [Lagenidium giganteum]|uniref:Uncharacterized protein n=1 Tax=Lagenidium giganteum TaxID=4803 RepID=A0AAV2YSN5_9STRA|nr:TPA: hypothetical protein N0F65_011930 [Lagenidium giganteum]